jgi:hypothetical protein
MRHLTKKCKDIENGAEKDQIVREVKFWENALQDIELRDLKVSI